MNKLRDHENIPVQRKAAGSRLPIRAAVLILASFFLIFLSGCVTHRENVSIRPSAVPEKQLTKTAIAPSSAALEISYYGEDPWEECEYITESSPSPLPVSDITSEEFRRRVQITFMIPNEETDSTFIAKRCMNGKVYACLMDGENNCSEPLDFSFEANETMQTLCEDPARAGQTLNVREMNRSSAYEWACLEGKPVLIGIRAEADAAGYDKALWKEIPAPGNEG